MSSFLDYSVKDKSDLAGWVLRKLGHGLATVEITSEQLTDCINDALEYFTKYIQYENGFLAVNLDEYVEGVGVKLPDNVASIYGLDSRSIGTQSVHQLFSIPNQMMNAGFMPSAFGPHGGGWTTFALSRDYLDMIERMVSGGSGGFQFNFNDRTKILSMVPDPVKQTFGGIAIVKVREIRDEDQIVGEHHVKEYTLALAKMQVGINRSKITGVQLLGGGSIEAQMFNEGKAEKERIELDIRESQGPFAFFVG